MRFFGTTINETIRAFSAHKEEVDEIWSSKKITKYGGKRAKDMIIVITRCAVSLILLGLAIYLLVNDNKSDSGYSLIGFIAGYWLK